MPSFRNSGGETGCLLIHGFGGSSDEMLPLGKYLADQDFSVLGVELPGHGTDKKNAGKATWQDWLEAAKTGFDSLASSGVREIFTIGHSAGSLLALLLCVSSPIKGVVALAPIPYLQPWQVKALTIANQGLKYLPYGQNHSPTASGINFPLQLIPTSGLLEIVHLIEFTQTKYANIHQPVLVVTGKRDLTIPRDTPAYLAEKLTNSSVEITTYREFGHLPMYEKGREKVWVRVKEFISRALLVDSS